MADITAAGRIPLLVGGTMLYVKALREGLAELPQADPELRAAIDAEAAAQGWPALHAELARTRPGHSGAPQAHRCPAHPARRRSPAPDRTHPGQLLRRTAGQRRCPSAC
jgi:hypothetical protein